MRRWTRPSPFEPGLRDRVRLGILASRGDYQRYWRRGAVELQDEGRFLAAAALFQSHPETNQVSSKLISIQSGPFRLVSSISGKNVA